MSFSLLFRGLTPFGLETWLRLRYVCFYVLSPEVLWLQDWNMALMQGDFPELGQ